MSTQLDLFPTTARIDEPFHVDLATRQATVRARLDAFLAEARAADTLPWPLDRARVVAMVSHTMASWLPREERLARRAAFVAELTRFGHADLAAHAVATGRDVADGVE